MRGRKYSCWAAFPKVINTGATIFIAEGQLHRRTGGGAFLVENILLEDGPVRSPEALRPHAGAPAAAIQDVLPPQDVLFVQTSPGADPVAHLVPAAPSPEMRGLRRETTLPRGYSSGACLDIASLERGSGLALL